MIVDRIETPLILDQAAFQKAESHELLHRNWVKADHVKVEFRIVHDGANFYLAYTVEEEQVRGVNSGYNSPVWEDSCVEFFFSLKGDEKNYYNFEFNAIGAVLGAYGPDRHSRNSLDLSLLKQIETNPSLGKDPVGTIDSPTTWSLFVKIPVSILRFNEISDLSGRDGHANFYKCGDMLDQPHFISWKPVVTPTPDFHTPRFFGQLSFM